MTFTAEAEQLTGVCRNIFGDESRWITADGYPHSLALSIIDSIYSTGSNYQAVINVVNEYRAYRRAQGGDADRDGTEVLLATFKEAGGSVGWAELVNNRKPAQTECASERGGHTTRIRGAAEPARLQDTGRPPYGPGERRKPQDPEGRMATPAESAVWSYVQLPPDPRRLPVR